METLERLASPGWHAVQFYETDAELARTVVPYLAGAMKAGGTAVVIATAAHRSQFGAGLEHARIDVQRAISDGTLVARDADEALGLFMRDGRVDEDAFWRTIGALVRQAAARPGPVRIYGEMVASLWRAGHLPAVIELEQLWNDLAAKVDFALLCGYLRSDVSGAEFSEALDRVCALHTDMTTGDPRTLETSGSDPRAREVSCSFPAAAETPREARHFITGALTRWGYSGALLDDAQLVISELATNAVVHADSALQVDARIESGDLFLSVRDRSQALPTVLAPPPGAPHGRGLRVVSALAEEWGVDTESEGKTVWARLRS